MALFPKQDYDDGSTWQDEFHRALNELDLPTPHDVIADGKLHRFSVNGKRGNSSGWYTIFQDEITAGVVGNWATGQKANWHFAPGRLLSPQERVDMEARWQAAKKANDEARAIDQANAASFAQKRWDELKQAPGDHPYLVAKGVASYGLRQGNERLYVPLYDETNRIVSLQSIDDKGVKLFAKDGRTKGCFFIMGELKNVFYVAEGYATGASIHAASGEAVAIAFNSGNLLPAIESLKQLYPMATMVICADDDQAKPVNIGMEKAKEAATAFNLKLMTPSFTSEQIASGASDFNDYARLNGLAALKEIFRVTPAPDVFRTMTIRDIRSMPPVKWLINGLVPEKSFSVMYGAPGHGKSFLALDFALCVATGIEWHDEAVLPGAVLYIAAEGLGGLNRRISAWLAHHSIDGDDVNLFVLPSVVNMCAALDVQKLLRTIKDLNRDFKFIIIDTVARSLSGADENSSKEIGEFINACDLVKEATGCAVMGVHHSGKDIERGMRGSSAMLGAVDSCIRIEKDDHGIVTLTHEKLKDPEPYATTHFEMKKVTFGLGMESVVLEKTDQKGSYQKSLTFVQKKAMQILFDCIAQSSQSVRGLSACTIDLWKGECFRRELSAGDNRAKDSGFRAVMRALDKKGQIGMENGLVFTFDKIESNKAENDDEF